MVYILSEGDERRQKTFSYQVVKEIDGVRSIISEGNKFSDPTEILRYMEKMKKSLAEGKVFYQRDRNTNSYGYIIYEDANNPDSEIDSSFGWQAEEEVKEHVMLMRLAIAEGSKVIF